MANAGSSPASVLRRSRLRANHACKNCYLRRVRCNVDEAHPCDSCRKAGSICEPRLLNQKLGPRHHGSITSNASHHAEWAAPGEVQESRHFEAAGESVVSGKPANDVDGEIFVGESSLLPDVAREARSFRNQPMLQQRSAEIYHTLGGPAKDRLHRGQSWGLSGSEVRELLNRHGAFSLPARPLRDFLVKIYFEWFHPCFPILDYTEFRRLYDAESVPAMLMQGVLFVGALMSRDEELIPFGVDDRQKAKAQLYRNARMIHDLDFERDQFTTIQAMFLMSFWRGGAPFTEKNTRFWLGAAISLTQDKGFHRAVRPTSSTTTQLKMRKRLWWALYVREMWSSAALGLPPRIQTRFCDVEPLLPRDFEDGESACDGRASAETQPHVLYVLEMSKLAALLEKVIQLCFAPTTNHSDPHGSTTLKRSLEQWGREVPLEIRADNGEYPNFWSTMAYMAYNYVLMIYHRSAFLDSPLVMNGSDSTLADRAACDATRLCEAVLSQSLVDRSPLHFSTGIFAALCIHAMNIRRLQGPLKDLAVCRAEICMLGLKQTQKCWEFREMPWLLILFFKILDKKTSKRLQAYFTDGESSEAVDENRSLPMEAMSQQANSMPPSMDLLSSTFSDHEYSTQFETMFPPMFDTLDSQELYAQISADLESSDFDFLLQMTE